MDVLDSPKKWTWHDIKCELAKRGHTFSSLARSLSVSPQAVTNVKNRGNRRVQSRIAKILATKPQAIWPDRYRRAA